MGKVYSSRPFKVDVSPQEGSDNLVSSGGVFTAIKDSTTSIYRFKGSVPTYGDLPTTGNEIGDVYDVEDTGKNYAWSGDSWDDLGGGLRIVVSDDTALTSVQCEKLKVGDKVILADTTTNSETLYLVSYKDESNLYLDSYTIIASGAYVVAKEVQYKKSEGVWSCYDWFDRTLNEVRANTTVPSGTTPTPLQNLQVGNNFYSAPEGGAKVVTITNSTANVETDIVLTQEQQEDLFEVVQGNTFAKDAVINYVWNYGAVGSVNYLNIELSLTDKYNKTWISGVFGDTPSYIYQASYYFDGNNVCLSISKVNVNEYCIEKTVNHFVVGDTIQFTEFEYKLLTEFLVPFKVVYKPSSASISATFNYSGSALVSIKENTQKIGTSYLKLSDMPDVPEYDAKETYYLYENNTYSLFPLINGRIFRQLASEGLSIIDSTTMTDLKSYKIIISISKVSGVYTGTVGQYYLATQPTVPNPLIPVGTTPEDLETVKIGEDYFTIPQGGGGEIVEPTDTTGTKLEEQTPYFEQLPNYLPRVDGDFEGIAFTSALNIWTDGNNVYYSEGERQYVFDKESLLWIPKVWEGLDDFYGSEVWNVNGRILYDDGPSTDSERHYVLNELGQWESVDWRNAFPDPVDFYGNDIWTDGTNIYYSYGPFQYVLNYNLSLGVESWYWDEIEWIGLTDFGGYNIWTDGDNIYYSNGSNQKVLDKATNTWVDKTWNGLIDLYRSNIWTDGENIYCSQGSDQYVLNKSTDTWTAKTWYGESIFNGNDIWTDGTNIYDYPQSANILVKPKTNVNSKPLVNSNIPCKVSKPTQPFLFSQIEFSEEKLNIEPENVKIMLWDLVPIFKGETNYLDEPLAMESTLIETGEDVAIAILPRIPMVPELDHPWAVNDIQSVLTILVKYAEDGSGGYLCEIRIADWNGIGLRSYSINPSEIEGYDLEEFISQVARLVDESQDPQPVSYNLPQVVDSISLNFTNSIIVYRAGINDYEIVRVKDVDKLIKSFIIDGNSGSSSSSSSSEE